MASRAHVIHDYSFNNVPARPRRELRYWSEDPVVLPRGRGISISSAFIAAALTASGIVAASAYAVYYSAPPTLLQTPTISMERDWQTDDAVTRANVTNQLSGPAYAVPNAASVQGSFGDDDTSIMSEPHNQVTIDDSAPGAQDGFPKAVPTVPAAPAEAPYPDSTRPAYPNPTTTPPEAVAPPSAAPATPTPALDPENPYR